MYETYTEPCFYRCTTNGSYTYISNQSFQTHPVDSLNNIDFENKARPPILQRII